MTSNASAPRPTAIISFERLFLFTIPIAVVQTVIGWDDLVRRAPPSTIITMLALTLGTEVALALLAARARNSAARWVLAAMLIIGVPLYLSSLERGTVIGLGLLSLLQALLQTVSVSLLFTRSARAWFRNS